ncbi:MAG: protein kinase [Gemmatimonadetes bacterium]|nr:protein kinase [Gemmatimonadota bacterium]
MSDLECSRCGNTLGPTARFCLKCGEAQEPLSQRLRNALGPEYELLGELGRGGAAVVFSVRDTARKQYLAVKVIHPELMTSHTVVERFRREARYVAQLDHPNILSVVFSSEKAGLVFYAMPRIGGKTLAKYLDNLGQLPIQASLSILGQVAAGLHHAHAHGVIHRDVKPSNIMIEESGHALILDFGVAKALWGDGVHLSASGEVIGSPRYMSAEQASGSKHIDHRTDIYSWGVVAFHMLAGRVPFDDEGVQAILYKQMSVEPPDLRALRPDLPKDLTEAIHRCMAKDPARRWENVLDAARAMGCTV